MEEVLPGWAQIAGWGGLIAAAVLSIFRGWLIPKSTVDRLVGQLEARLADRDALIEELRATVAALSARNDLQANQIAQLVGVGHASAATVRRLVGGAGPNGAIPSAPTETGGGGAAASNAKARARRRQR